MNLYISNLQHLIRSKGLRIISFGPYFFFFLLMLLLALSSCRRSKHRSEATNKQHKTEAKKYDEDDLVKRAKKYLGVKYRLGGREPSGFDCSGFVRYVFEPYGIKMPATAIEQSQTGKEISKNEARKGDLIFFKGGNAKSRTVGHVGIIVTDRGEAIRFIHASTSKGIMISALDEQYFAVRLVRIRRAR